MPILKVFPSKAEAGEVLKRATLIEPYDAFLLVQATPAAAAALNRAYLVEDITDQYQLALPNVTVSTARPRVTAAGVRRHPAYKSERLKPGPHHYLVQLVGPVKDRWLAGLRKTGAVIREPRGAFTYVVRADKAKLAKVAALPFVRWVGHLPHAARVGPGLAGASRRFPLPRQRSRRSVYRVEVFDGVSVGKVAAAVRRIGFRVLAKHPKASVLLVGLEATGAAGRRRIQALSAVHGVKFIRQQALPRTSNDVATGIMGNAYAAVRSNGLRLTGAGEIVAVCDTGLDSGDPASIHPDFAGRVIAIRSYPITSDWRDVITNSGADDGPADLDSGHGTHVAGSVLGDGSASAGTAALIRGHAHKAKLVFQAIEQEMKWRPSAPDDLTEERFVLAGIPVNLGPLFKYAYAKGARVHSNSWGGGDAGDYDDQCGQFDRFVWKHKDFCFVVSAGNDGTDEDGDGAINLMSVTSPGTAKNCITVGASENMRRNFDAEKYGGADWWPEDFPVSPYKADPMADRPDEVVPFSSRGPTADGRIKPDVVAPGTFILSTRSSRIASNNFAWAPYPPDKKHYFHMGGTSMATPLTSGAVALLRECLRTRLGVAKPSAALLKALLIAGAERLPGTAPTKTLADNHQGFGRVNLDRSLRHTLVTVDGRGLKTGQQSAIVIKVPAGKKTLRIALCYTDYPGPKLVNNLNLIVSDPASKRYVGNPSSASSSTALAFDSTNNVEVIEVRKAAAGTWTANVVASNVSKGPQDFALVAVLI